MVYFIISNHSTEYSNDSQAKPLKPAGAGNVKAVCGMIAVSARPARTSLDLEAEGPKRR